MNEKRQGRPRFFVSYCIDDNVFVYATCNALSPYLGREHMFLFEDHARPDEESFLRQIAEEVSMADGVLFFLGRRFGPYQASELERALLLKKSILLVGVGGQQSPTDFDPFVVQNAGGRPMLFDSYTGGVAPAPASCACDIHGKLEDWWNSHFTEPLQDWSDGLLTHGLPSVPQPFDYEKTIIEFYSAVRLAESDRGACDGAVHLDPARAAALRSKWPQHGIERLLRNGVPARWPVVPMHVADRPNLLDPTVAGDIRSSDGEALVAAAALKTVDPLRTGPTFPEAGPRRLLALPKRGQHQLNVAILVAGGIAPGINAVIDAIVKRHFDYHDADGRSQDGYGLRVHGIVDGLISIDGANAQLAPNLVPLMPDRTAEHATRGGSMLGTSRDVELLRPETRHERLEQIARVLSSPQQMVDVLYVICGDGGMKAAHAIWHHTNRWRAALARQPTPPRPLSVVTVPKTMDNDVLWVWQSFGFLSAVDEARRIVETLHTEVRSNPRLGVVQLFGSDSGFVVSHAVLASAAGHVTLALIPEIEFSMVGVARYLKRAMWSAARSTDVVGPRIPHGLVVLAENAIPLDALECLGLTEQIPPDLAGVYDELRRDLADAGTGFALTKKETQAIRQFVERRKRRVPFEGQTSDTNRKLGLRIVAETLPFLLKQRGLLPDAQGLNWEQPDWDRLRVVCSEPRHLVRALEPSTADIITGQRLGLLAVDAAMAGYTDCMVSQWLTEFTIIPLELVVLGRKRIPPQGMFWKSVVSKTRQPADLVQPYPRGASPE